MTDQYPQLTTEQRAQAARVLERFAAHMRETADRLGDWPEPYDMGGAGLAYEGEDAEQVLMDVGFYASALWELDRYDAGLPAHWRLYEDAESYAACSMYGDDGHEWLAEQPGIVARALVWLAAGAPRDRRADVALAVWWDLTEANVEDTEEDVREAVEQYREALT